MAEGQKLSHETTSRNPLTVARGYRGELYDGEHEAVIGSDHWAEVQRIIVANRHERKLGKQTRYPSLLTGVISDPDGQPMTPVSTHKGSRRHHYYLTRLKAGEEKERAWRVPAGELDRTVMAAVCDWLRSNQRSCEPRQLMADRELANELPGFSIPEQRKVLIELGMKVQVGTTELYLRIDHEAQPVVSLPLRMVRRGTELKVVLGSCEPQRAPDPVLVKLVALAMSARKSLFFSKADQLTSHYSKRHLWQLLRISFLAPDIVTAIIEGRQPPSLTGRRLLRVTDLPLDWPGQRRVLGLS